jgi:hypothetical protein
MTDHYPVPDEGSWEARNDAGADRPAAWHNAPLPSPGPPPAVAGQDRAALSTAATRVSTDAPYIPVTQNQSPPKLYAHKNEILYAFGGVFIPGLVFLLMGGKKQTGILMLCSLAASIILCFVLVGFFTLVATYIWSIVACYKEARRQNEAHGFVS